MTGSPPAGSDAAGENGATAEHTVPRGGTLRLTRYCSLARSAQALKAGSNIGGSGAITAALFGCAQLNLRAALNPTTVNWQTGLGSNRVSQATGVAEIASTRLLLGQVQGTNEFTFASSHVAVTETITAWTQGASYAAQGCTKPTFVSFSASRDGRASRPALPLR